MLCHAAELMTTVLAPAASSCWSSVRPSRAVAPRKANVFDDTNAPVSRADPLDVGMSVIGGLMVSGGSDSVLELCRHWPSSAHVIVIRRATGPFGPRGAARSTIRTS